MKNPVLFLLTMATLSTPSLGAVQMASVLEQRSVVLTIYNPMLTLVQEERLAALSPGTNTISFTWGGSSVNPQTVVLDSVEPQDTWVLRGSSFLAGSNSMLYELESSRGWSGRLRLSYFLSGFSWSARYDAFTDPNETTLSLVGWASITNNTAESYRNAKVRLVLGTPHLLTAPAAERAEMAQAAKALREADELDRSIGVSRSGFSEYSLYTLKSTESFEPNQTRQVATMRAAKVPIHKYYQYDPTTYGNAVAMLYEFKNSQQNGLGEPMPGGLIRVYRRDRDGTLALVGEDNLAFTPRDEVARLYLGNAGNIVVDRKLMSTQRANEVVDPKTGRVLHYDQVEEYRIAVRNRKSTPAEVRIKEQIIPPWSMLEQSHRYEKLSANTIQFTLSLQPDKEEVITYKVSRTITP